MTRGWLDGWCSTALSAQGYIVPCEDLSLLKIIILDWKLKICCLGAMVKIWELEYSYDKMVKMWESWNTVVTRRIDCANSLIHGSTDIKKLQRVQTSVARVVSPNLSQLPATALLNELHWLPVNSRITFKLACLTYKLFKTGQPAYLHTLLHHYTPTRTYKVD